MKPICNRLQKLFSTGCKKGASGVQQAQKKYILFRYGTAAPYTPIRKEMTYERHTKNYKVRRVRMAIRL